MKKEKKLTSDYKGKKIFLAFLIFLFSLLMWNCSKAASGPDELDVAIREASDYLNDKLPAGNTIVILNVQSDSEALSAYIIDELHNNAVNDTRFSTVNRQQLDYLRADMNVQWSSEVADNLALEFGRVFDAQTVVTGRVSQVDKRYRFTIRALDVQTALVQGQFNYNIAASKTITALMRDGR